ncbi:NGG1 interacting factor 3 [Yamadazyma tenuis]|uniref:NGG1p interacting factor 3 n=1 Tax=Candida tenuis (strain ATCC 10573 / BCRC 21748 / CBS 615 / JCM 9827 / NBRC 10315 / NRRL Y-1498 / VKM Y-70) TaxID=590646 RepID=G3B1R6_CANTC|nr:NGG1p interacting factor 3 [Yamadazyma tenuis ATCC 10573]EGV64512.1 NGG1p interacting factor 3 [Yamadazyma tenuis ATCC 10573]WEJ97277.1 NGG1 interacting factor 3 [Yamadazyma tenuis]
MSKVSLKRAVSAIQKFYPIRLADSSWDNTGLLVEAYSEKDTSASLKILLTIDLTQSVVDEAISHNTNLIMAYHPFIFRGLKSITSKDPQQRSLLKLIKNDISVYCPHTAVDSAVGGVNDFLVDAVSKESEIASKSPITPDSLDPNCGAGRIINLASPISLEKAVERVKEALGLKYVQVAVANGKSKSHEISSIAICAGSGGGVFKGVEADLYFTGELSHHEALFFNESGSSVIVCNHSNTERAFLKVFKDQLQSELEDAEIIISQSDKDPFETW